MLPNSRTSGSAWWAVAMLGLACVIAGSLSLQAQAKTTKDGVYSEVQAKRGATFFGAKCAICHGKALEGGGGPPLSGADFLGFWDKMPVSELVTKIATSMPDDAPGTTTRPQAADVVAYILQRNKMPAGDADLASTDAALKAIAIAK